MAEKVLIQRMGALGDVIMTTPVVRRLRFVLGKDAIIHFRTLHPGVFRNNPFIDGVNVEPPKGGYTRDISLELAYERRPTMHAVDAFMMEVFADCNWPAKEMMLHQEAFELSQPADMKRFVCFHPGVNTKSRSLSREFWLEVIEGILALGLTPVLIGAGGDHRFPEIPEVIDYHSALNIHQIAYLIGRSACFISADTGISHIAGTTQTPMISVYTMARGAYRMPHRNGRLGHDIALLEPDLSCIGCFRTMWNLHNCERGDFACVNQNAVTSEQVLNQVRTICSDTWTHVDTIENLRMRDAWWQIERGV